MTKQSSALTGFEIHKRQETLFSLIRTSLAILISLGLVFVVIMLVSPDPLQAVKTFVTGPFTSVRRLGNVLEAMTPLIFTGLAACVMFQAKQFSLIGDGGFYIGALASVAFTVWFPIQNGVSTALGLLVGLLVGLLCGVLPGFLKAKWNVNEFVVSMMFNYILISMGQYLFLNKMRDPNSGNVASFPIPMGDRFPKLIPGTKVHLGMIVALVMSVLIYLFLFHTRQGFFIRMTGANPKFAKHMGINPFLVMFAVQILGAGIAGMGGATEMFGMYDRFLWQDTLGFGFDGMTVAILAGDNPILVPIGALFIAYMRVGTEIMARTNNVPNETVFMVQGIVMLLITATGFLAHWRHRMLLRTAKAQSVQGEEAGV